MTQEERIQQLECQVDKVDEKLTLAQHVEILECNICKKNVKLVVLNLIDTGIQRHDSLRDKPPTGIKNENSEVILLPVWISC